MALSVRPTIPFSSEEEMNAFLEVVNQATGGNKKLESKYYGELLKKGLQNTQAESQGVVLDDRPIQCFPTITVSGNSDSEKVREKFERFQKVKEILGIDPSADEILMSIQELIEKASELGQVSQQSIYLNGIRGYCESLISHSVKGDENEGHAHHGKRGINDGILDETFKMICSDILEGSFDPSKDLVTLSYILSQPRKNIGYPTGISWAEKRGYLDMLNESHPESRGKGKKGILVEWVKNNPDFVNQLP